MLYESIMSIFSETWPMLLIITVIISSMRITYLVKNNIRPILYKELLSLAFVIYVICLFYVVTFQDVSWSSSNFIPFKEMFRYPVGSYSFIKNVLGNMLMFIPYGFFISYFLKIKKPLLVFILSLITSVTIESTQLIIGRVFDVDDIMLNVVGGMIGFVFFLFISSIKHKLPKILQKNIIYDIIAVILLVLGLLYLARIIRIGV